MSNRTMWMVAGLAAAASAAHAQTLDASRAFANELYSDSTSRTSALDQDVKAFAPKVGGYSLFRYNVNQRNNVPNSNSDTAVGFQAAYTKLTLAGNVFDESWSYGFQLKFNEFDGNAVLDDAWGMLKFEDQWSLKWGQFKMPVLREENISDSKQLAANRSVTNSVFTQSRSQGLLLAYTGDNVRGMFGFGDGLGSRNTDYTAATESDYAVTGRAEYKWAGDWKQYDEFTAFKNTPYFGAVGGALHFQTGGHTVGTSHGNTWEGTVDAMAKGNGWNAYVAGIGRSSNVTNGIQYRDFGFLAQVGAFVGPKWELFGRYDVIIPDGDRTANDSFNTFTIGANRYFIPESHAIKLTLNVLYFADEQSAGLAPASTLTGVLASSEASQWAFQAQIQFMF